MRNYIPTKLLFLKNKQKTEAVPKVIRTAFILYFFIDTAKFNLTKISYLLFHFFKLQLLEEEIVIRHGKFEFNNLSVLV